MTTSSVSQAPTLILQQGVGELQVSQLPMLVLTKVSTESDVSQMYLMCLSRRVGKRVFVQIDNGVN